MADQRKEHGKQKLTKHEAYTMRGGGATKKLFVAFFVALLAALMLTPSAFGAVKGTRSIEVDYGIDFVVLDGYPANTNVRVDVLRGPNDVLVGPTTQRTDSQGLLEINHIGGGQFGAGGDCWGPSTLNPNAPNVTPDILPGDKVQSTILNADGTPVDPTDQDFTVTRDIKIVPDATTVTGAATTDTTDNTITMIGHVRSTADAPINISGDVLELRLNANGFTWESNNNRKDLRAQVLPEDFTADGDGDPTTFKHVFNVTQNDVVRADGNNFEQIFEWSAGLAGNELTVYSGEGGVLEGCPPQAKTAITGVSTHTVAGKPAVNSNNIANDMVVSGIANGAQTVSVQVPGGSPHAGTLSPAFDAANPNANQTWTATIPASELAALPQGQFNITANFTAGPNQAVPETSTLSVLKDTQNPAAPTASPPAGRYSSAQAVTLNESEADTAAKIHYTIGQTPPDPDANDTVFTGQIQVTASQTIKAVVIDGAGNVSPVATFAYTIGANTVPAAPTNVTATAGNASATVNWTAPNNGGSAITEYRVRVFLASNSSIVRTEVFDATQTSRVIGGLTNGTAYKFQVRAVNAVGLGPFSADSNTVTPTVGTTVGTPSAPRIGTAVNGSRTDNVVSATAKWSAPTSNGGSPITQYRVEAFLVTSTGTLSPVGSMTTGASARQLKVTNGLSSGLTYRFKVEASNTPAGQTPVWGPASA